MLCFGKADVERIQTMENEINVELQTMENEINVELQTMKNTIMRIERFLKSDKGQARIRELWQSRQVRPASITGPNGGHNAVRNHGNFRSLVRGQNAPTLPKR